MEIRQAAQAILDGTSAAPGGRDRHGHRARDAGRLRRVPQQPGRPVGDPSAEGGRRRGQRHGRLHGPDRLQGPAAGGRRPLLRARRHLPEPRGQPAGPEEPRRPAARGRRARRGPGAGLRRRRRPLLRGRRARRAGLAVHDHRPGRGPRTGQAPGRDDHPQPDHLRGGARRSCASTAACRSRTRVGHSFIKQEMASTGAVFGGEHSAHYYFQDFWKADTGMLAAMHVLAALGGQQDRRCRSWPRTTPATPPPARSTARSPTRPAAPRRSGRRSGAVPASPWTSSTG